MWLQSTNAHSTKVSAATIFYRSLVNYDSESRYFINLVFNLMSGETQHNMHNWFHHINAMDRINTTHWSLAENTKRSYIQTRSNIKSIFDYRNLSTSSLLTISDRLLNVRDLCLIPVGIYYFPISVGYFMLIEYKIIRLSSEVSISLSFFRLFLNFIIPVSFFVLVLFLLLLF